MIQLPAQVLKELNIFKNGIVIKANDDYDLIYKLFRNGNFDINQSYIFCISEEILHNENEFESIYKIIRDFNLDAYISQSTTSSYYRSTHPLTNFIIWRRHQTRNSISWNEGENHRVLTKENFSPNKDVSTISKSNKGILSVRKVNEMREALFLRNPMISDGIVRYMKWPTFGCRELENEELINSTPTLDELIDEYNSSYFSFVCETIDDSHQLVCNITEKTIIAFLTGTMPILLGSRGIVSELESIGFKLWNSEFGFENGDNYFNNCKFKIDSYMRCINNVNSLSMNLCDEYWNENIKYIQHNYDLMNYLLFSEDIFDKFKIFNPNNLEIPK